MRTSSAIASAIAEDKPLPENTARLLRKLARMVTGEPANRAELTGENWRFYMHASAAHRLAPALGYGLPDFAPPNDNREDSDDYSGEDILAFYRAATRLNRQRNQDILVGLQQAITVLNAAGIVPTLVKGASFIHDQQDPALATRVMSDFDVLVGKSEYPSAIEILQANGFGCESESERAYYESLDVSKRREYAPMHNGSPFFLDLHRDLFLPERFDARSTESIIQDACEYTTPLGHYRIPTPVDRLLHSVFHSCIQNGAHRRGDVDIRQLADTHSLIESAGESVLETTGRYFFAAGYRNVWQRWALNYDAMLSTQGDSGNLPAITRYRLQYPLLSRCADSVCKSVTKLSANPRRFCRPVTWRRYLNRRWSSS